MSSTSYLGCDILAFHQTKLRLHELSFPFSVMALRVVHWAKEWTFPKYKRNFWRPRGGQYSWKDGCLARYQNEGELL